MNDSTEKVILAKELSTAQFLRLAFLGSVRSTADGRKLVLDPGASKMMKGIAGGLPFLFLGVFVAGFVKLTWANVIAFFVVLIGVYVWAMRSTKLVEKSA